MATIGDILIDVRAGTARFKRDLMQARRMTKKTTKSIRKSFDRASSAVLSMRGAIIGLGTGMAIRSFVKAADTAEGFATRLEVLLGSVEEGNRLFDDMATFAGRVPFEYEKIMASATSLAGVMKGGVDEINQWMPLIGDLAATTGLSVEDTTSQVIRMYSAGAAAADMFRERGVLSMLGFQAGVSYSAEETRKQMMAQWNMAGSQFKGATGKLAETWSGMTSMLSDKWFKFRTDTMDSGIFDFLKEGLRQVNQFLDDAFASGQMKEWAQDLSDFGVKAIKDTVVAVGWLKDSFDGLGMLWKGSKIIFLELSEAMWDGLNKARKATNSLSGFIAKFSNEGSAAWKKWQKSNAMLEEQEFVLKGIRSELASTKKELADAAIGYVRLSDRAQEWVNQVERGSKRVKTVQSEVKTNAAELRAEAEKAQKVYTEQQTAHEAMLKSASALYDAVATPHEEFINKMRELNQLVNEGYISWETYDRGVAAAQEGIGKVAEKGKTFIKDFRSATEGWASSFSSDLNEMLWNADTTFGDILKSFMKMVTQMIIQQAIVKPLMTTMFGASATVASAKGNVFGPSGVQAFANGGVVDSPTIFPFKNGTGLMGEAGPEGILPLSRNASGVLGVNAEGMGGGGGGVTVNIINNSETDVTAEEGTDALGNKTLEVYIDDTMSRKLITGRSAKVLKDVYRLAPQTTGR